MHVVHSSLKKSQVRYIKERYLKGDKPIRIYLGEGATATVYGYKSDLVIRIQDKDRGGSSSSYDSYLFSGSSDYDPTVHYEWVKLCLRNQHLTAVPKYRLLMVDKLESPTVVVTVLERLVNAWEYFNEKYDDPYISDRVAVDLDNILLYSKTNKIKSEEGRPHYDVTELLLLGSLAKEDGVVFNDLHDENYMIRGETGEVVITDPIC